jgi:hypothetical protein
MRAGPRPSCRRPQGTRSGTRLDPDLTTALRERRERRPSGRARHRGCCFPCKAGAAGRSKVRMTTARSHGPRLVLFVPVMASVPAETLLACGSPLSGTVSAMSEASRARTGAHRMAAACSRPTGGSQRRRAEVTRPAPLRRASARSSSPSLMCRMASAKPRLAGYGPEGGSSETGARSSTGGRRDAADRPATSAGVRTIAASSLNSRIPRRRARIDASTSVPSDRRLLRPGTAVSRVGTVLSASSGVT